MIFTSYTQCPVCNKQALSWYEKIFPSAFSQKFAPRYTCQSCDEELTVGFVGVAFSLSPLVSTIFYLVGTDEGRAIADTVSIAEYLGCATVLSLLFYFFGTTLTRP